MGAKVATGTGVEVMGAEAATGTRTEMGLKWDSELKLRQLNRNRRWDPGNRDRSKNPGDRNKSRDLGHRKRDGSRRQDPLRRRKTGPVWSQAVAVETLVETEALTGTLEEPSKVVTRALEGVSAEVGPGTS